MLQSWRNSSNIIQVARGSNGILSISSHHQKALEQQKEEEAYTEPEEFIFLGSSPRSHAG